MLSIVCTTNVVLDLNRFAKRLRRLSILKCILANKRYTTVVFSTLLLLVCPRKYLYLCVWCLHVHASACGFGFVWMCLHDCACVHLPAFCFLVTICNAHACITHSYKESR